MSQIMNGFIEAFRFERQMVPLCRLQDAVAGCTTYFIVVYLLKRYMQNRKAFDLRTIVIFHNYLLAVSSALLLGCFIIVLIEKSAIFTPWEMICSSSFHSDGRLHLLYYLVSSALCKVLHRILTCLCMLSELSG